MYRYEPAKKRNQVMGTLLNHFIQRVFDDSSSDLMQQLTKTEIRQSEFEDTQKTHDKRTTDSVA